MNIESLDVKVENRKKTLILSKLVNERLGQVNDGMVFEFSFNLKGKGWGLLERKDEQM